MYHEPLIIAFKKQITFYKSLKPLDYIFLFLIYIFVSWNGIQFIMNPKHLLLILNHYYLNENINTVIVNQTTFLPSFGFIILTFILIYYLLKVYYEIGFNSFFYTEKIGIKQKFNILVDFTIPTLYHVLGIIFILTTIYLALIIIYMLLMTIGLFFVLDIVNIIMFTVFYYIIGIFVFHVCLFDFVLPEMLHKKTFSELFKNMLTYFSNNILNIIIFYLFKLILVSSSVILFIYFLIFAFKLPVFQLPLITDFADGLNATTTLLLSVTTSIIIFSVFIHFFSLYCHFLKKELFKDYFLIEPHDSVDQENIHYQ